MRVQVLKHLIGAPKTKAARVLTAFVLVLVQFAAPMAGLQTAFAAGGDFSIDFAAAAPFTYDHATGGGAWNDGDVGDLADLVEQLEGGQFACGDVVTYMAEISVKASPVHALQTIELDFAFQAANDGSPGAAQTDILGVAINYGQVENGDDGTGNNPGAGAFGLDSGMQDDGGSTAALVSESLVPGPLFENDSEILGTVRIDDLEAGERVILRLDVQLACRAGDSPTGTLKGFLRAGRVISPVQETINTGEQAIPFLQIGDLAGAGEPLLVIHKTVTAAGGTCPGSETLDVTAGDTVKYCYAVSNPGTKDLFDVSLTDDNGTASTADDFELAVGDISAGETVSLTQSLALSVGGEVVNTATVTGNNGQPGGQFQTLTAADTATVNVAGLPNQPPAANDDAVTTQEDTAATINAAANDTDVNGNLDPASANTDCAECSLPSDGELVDNGDGTFAYTPNANFNGSDSFVYEICDTDGLCDTATVTITIAAVNDAPAAADDSYSTAEDTPLTVNAPGVLDNDGDVDGDALSAGNYTQPANGSVTLNADGSFTYTPNLNFNGPDEFTYQACDGTLCSTATVKIVVSPVNDPPAAAADEASVSEDGSVDIPVLGNDSDPENNPLTVTGVSDPEHGTAAINDDGTVKYTPDPDFCGEDSFTYTISDGQGGTHTAKVTVTVACVNDAPVANDDTAATDEDLPVAIPVTDNDSDPDGDPLTVSAVSDPANGSAAINLDGTVTYTPDPNYNGTDVFTYTLCDAADVCVTAQVTVTIGALNDPPAANDDAASTPEDTAVTIDAAANDGDVDGNLDPSTAAVVDDPEHGTLVNNGDGTFVYTPDLDYNGPDSFTYQICDTDGLCATAKVNLTVTPVNDAPVAGDDSYNATEDTPLTIDADGVLGNDGDVDEDALVVHSYDATSQFGGLVSLNPDGGFTYTPAENFCGQDTFKYTVADGQGGYDTATVTIAVACVNDAPAALDDAGSTDEDTVLHTAAPGSLANDDDVDGDSLTVSAVNGEAANVGEQITLASGALVTMYADGRYSYDPNGRFDGLAAGETAEDSFMYTVSDGEGGTDTATVTIAIAGVNDAPVAADDAYVGQQDETLIVAAPGVLANDSDVDGDELFVDRYDAASQFGGLVSLNPDGSFSYTPAPGFAGYDTFTYTIADGEGGTDTATVTITVEARNNRSISVEMQDFALDGASLSGAFVIANQSDGYDVQIVDLAVEVQYKVPGGGGWTFVQVVDGTCDFSPEANFLVADQQTVEFSGCELAEEIPDGATIRVTAKVQIFGRINGKGKAEGWFLDRLSK